MCNIYLQEILNNKLLNAANIGNISSVYESLAEGANPDAKDSDNDSAIYLAALNGDIEIVKLLCDNGADVNVKNNKDDTALDGAIYGRKLQVVNYLYGQGCQRKNSSNHVEILDRLKANGIEKLYHITHKNNIESIKENGGLMSWNYLFENGIDIPVPGGNELSRGLDVNKELEDYVRLCFVKDLPMFDGRENLKVLEIDVKVVEWDTTLFCDMNATANRATCGPGFEHLDNIDFEVISEGRGQYNRTTYCLYQAEVLVKTFIPIDLIKNI
jgi:hypothetical protein